MFTGIIKELGSVESLRGPRLRLRARLPRQDRGASVAVNGACLTVVEERRGLLGFDVSAETFRLTNLGALRAGSRVNLEPSLALGDVLGGHLVSGHIDATARLLALAPLPGGFARLRVALPRPLRKLVAYKGSIAVDGVSLTVTRAEQGFFESVLIPETLKATTLGRRRPGDRVNLEADLLARYVARALGAVRR